GVRTQRTAPIAVGGPVGGIGVASPRGSSVRTIYDRTPGGTAATPVGGVPVGGGIVGRYAPRSDPRAMPRGNTVVGNGAVVGTVVARASTPPIAGTRFHVPVVGG